MCLPGPGVDNSQASCLERRRIARGYRETMRCRDGSDIAVCRRNGLPSDTGAQRCIALRYKETAGCAHKQRQNALLKTEMKRIPAFTLWQRSDTEAQFR